MYFFLEQQQRGRESGRGLGKLGWREGRRERERPATGQLSPPNLGQGKLGEGGPRVGGVGPRDLIHLCHQKSSLLWHRYANVFILNLLSVSLSFFASLKKWRRDLHNFSGVSPSHLPVRPLLPSTPSLRHPILPPKKEVTTGALSAESQGESGQGERATSVVGK